MDIDIYRTERWENIKIDKEGFKAKYQVSDFGRIRKYNFKTSEWDVKHYKPFAKNQNFIFCRMSDNTSNAKSYTESIHRLVAKYFLEPPPEEKRFVIHLNYDNLNNHHSNLKWASTKEVQEHKKGNPKSDYMERAITNSTLTESKVMLLKMKLKRGKQPFYKLAKQFGISHTQLKRIRRGENWAHVTID